MTSASPRLILFITAVASFCTSFAASSVNVALPLVGSDFHLTGVSLNWVVTAFILTSAILVMPMGRLADLYGRHRVFGLGMILYCLSSTAAIFAPFVGWLYAARVLTGVGAAMAFSTVTAVLVAAFPPEKRGRVLGLNVAMVYTGMSAGPVLGGLVVHAWGWRSLFAVHAVVSALVVIFVVGKLGLKHSGSSRGRFDLVGALVYGLGLALVLMGLSSLPRPEGIALAVVGSLGLVAFWVYESRVEAPLFPVTLFTHNRTFAFSNLAAMISYCATFAVTFFLSLYLQVVLRFNPAVAGLILVTQPLVQAVFSPLSGHLSDRISPRFLASVGMGSTSLGLVLLAFLGPQTPVLWVVAALVFLGFGFALFSSPNTNSIMGSVEKKDLGVASATVATMRLVGQMLSMALALLLLSLILGNTPVDAGSADRFLQVQRWAFGIFAVLCALGIGASLARNSPQKA